MSYKYDLIKAIHEHSNACYDMAKLNFTEVGNRKEITQRIEDALSDIHTFIDVEEYEKQRILGEWSLSILKRNVEDHQPASTKPRT